MLRIITTSTFSSSCIDRVDQFDVQLFERLDSSFQQLLALWDVGTAAWIAGHDDHVGQFAFRVRLVQDLSPRAGVGVQPNDAGPERCLPFATPPRRSDNTPDDYPDSTIETRYFRMGKSPLRMNHPGTARAGPASDLARYFA